MARDESGGGGTPDEDEDAGFGEGTRRGGMPGVPGEGEYGGGDMSEGDGARVRNLSGNRLVR